MFGNIHEKNKGTFHHFGGRTMKHQQTSLSFMKLKVLFSSLLLLGLTQGCVDLKAIQDFANISAESAEYTALVDNYVDFPNRQKRYQPENQHARLDAMTQQRMTRKTELILRHKIIEEYMEALGELAADGIVDQTEELSQLTTALKSQAGTNPAETEAFGKIAGILTKAVSDGWRKRQLQELIGQSNAPLQQILKSLKHIVSDGFGGDLQNEEFAIQNYYGTLIANSSDLAAKAALAEWQEVRVATLADHSQALHAYATLLDKIAEGHQKLYDERKNLDAEQLLKQMKHSVKELKDLLDTIKKI
jgi:uncharacterized protein YgfB (UPF0149 family)